MNDIRDIHGPIIHHAHAWWPYLAIAVGLVAIVWLVRLLMHRRPLTAAERALRMLAAARSEHDPERFSTAVSQTIRDYVEAGFGVQAPRRTTEELLADLMADGSPIAAHRDELGNFLEYCDLAKYARAALSADDMAAMATSAETFVHATAGGAA